MTWVRTSGFSFSLPGEWRDESEHSFVSPDGELVGSLVEEPQPDDATLEGLASHWATSLGASDQCEVIETVEDTSGGLPAVTTRSFLSDEALVFMRSTLVSNGGSVFGLVVTGPAARRADVEAAADVLCGGLRLRRPH